MLSQSIISILAYSIDQVALWVNLISHVWLHPYRSSAHPLHRAYDIFIFSNLLLCLPHLIILLNLLIHIIFLRQANEQYLSQQGEDGREEDKDPEVPEVRGSDAQAIGKKAAQLIGDKVPQIDNSENEGIEGGLNRLGAHLAGEDHQGHEVKLVHKGV